jgi:hypothetical protein
MPPFIEAAFFLKKRSRLQIIWGAVPDNHSGNGQAKQINIVTARVKIKLKQLQTFN